MAEEKVEQWRDALGDLLIRAGQRIKTKQYNEGKVDHVKQAPNSSCNQVDPRLQDKPKHDGFDLSKLQSLYNRFGIDIKYNQSFVFLLNMVRKQSYMSIIRIVDKQTNTVEDLTRRIIGAIPEVESTFSNFSFDNASGGPYISKEQIYNICKEEKITPSGTIDDTIKMLIVHKEEEGKKLFSSVFEFKFAQIKKKLEEGIDVSDDFETIKKRFAQEMK